MEDEQIQKTPQQLIEEKIQRAKILEQQSLSCHSEEFKDLIIRSRSRPPKSPKSSKDGKKKSAKSPTRSQSLCRSPSNVSTRPLDIPLSVTNKCTTVKTKKSPKSPKSPKQIHKSIINDNKWTTNVSLGDNTKDKKKEAEKVEIEFKKYVTNDEKEVKDRSRSKRRNSKINNKEDILKQNHSVDNLFEESENINNNERSNESSPTRFSSPDTVHSAPGGISNNKHSYLHRVHFRSSSQDTVVSRANTNDGNTRNTPSNATVSMDSLARQALLAAQVLHLIPTTKARGRNFLHGRIAINSLLGSQELDRVFPTRDVTIFIGTWNMNGAQPPKELNDFVLPHCLENVPDILAIGTQESCSERFEWEVSLQETIGPSHVMLHSTVLGTIHLGIFIRRDLIWYCSICEEASLSVRTGTAFRTKGAVAIAFMIFGTSYLFVTTHLTAQQEKVKERVSDIKRIIRSLDLPKNLPTRHKNKGKRDVTQNFDFVFWFGDLNFRLNEPREQLLNWIENQNWPLPAHLPHGMLHTDQLQAVLADGAAFKGFREAQITFPPTYKYDLGSQRFDSSSKQRTPAYTDRILYKCRSNGLLPTARRGSSHSCSGVEIKPLVECLIYDSVPSMTTSDHKPVWGVFNTIIRPGIDTIPLAAGLFNREVYLEGIKRRAASMEKVKGISSGCAIQ